LYDLPDDYFSTFVPAVHATGLDDVLDVALRHVDPERLMTLVVGDRIRLGESLTALGHGEPAPLDPF
jgi:hypothetical protein